LAAAVGANDPTTITSGTAFSANLTSSGVITITATVDTAATYTLTITKGTFDDLQSVAIEDISNFGWSGARHISGDLDTYVSGGLAIPLGTFKPRFVINVMVTDGFVGYFDIASGKLKVYKSGSEATVNQLKNSSYDMILLG